MPVSRRQLLAGTAAAALVWRKADALLISAPGSPLLPPPGAPTGTPQYPDLFARYPVRPPFAVPGVDYRVGINTGVVLTDWRDMTNPGAGLGANSVSFIGVNNIVIDGVDFSFNQGCFLEFTNCNGVLIQNCYFGGPVLIYNTAGVINTDELTTNVTIQYCEIDQGGVFLILLYR